MPEAPVGAGACLILYVHYSGWGITGETCDCVDLARGLWVLGLTENRKGGGFVKLLPSEQDIGCTGVRLYERRSDLPKNSALRKLPMGRPHPDE
jgi:hypothetical protein